MTAESSPERLRRLEIIFPRAPIYFVTACTYYRRNILVSQVIHEALIRFFQEGPSHGAWVGGYVLMPDHFHLFVATDDQKITLAAWMKSLKNAISKTLHSAGVRSPHWQKTFFDHV